MANDRPVADAGEYDAVVIGEAPDFETVAAIKMMVLASGAMNEMVILEAADFNAIGERAAAMMAGRHLSRTGKLTALQPA